MQGQIDTLQEALESATKANADPNAQTEVVELVKNAITETLGEREVAA